MIENSRLLVSGIYLVHPGSSLHLALWLNYGEPDYFGLNDNG